MSQTHYFFALGLPASVKEALSQYFQDLQLPFGRSVHPEDYHITLAFLGNADPDALEQALTYTEQILKEVQSFPLIIQSFGTFGSKKTPRIFWSGVHDEPKLDELQRQIAGACIKAGIPLDQKPFRPHITLARKWMGDAEFQGEVTFPAALTFDANKVVLYQTHLNRTPKYEEKVVFHLKNN
ncbi:2'-5' RNA ligase [Bacillus ectoiniformans]|uniref:RNA 2',3'-cyclic phosphodiesterase n=1 Tax=Bacillus ectoiniformans TaxID=1494429 RepID=UPI00195B0949|nr:RNA 2',3'-cyclic phosphodiesterase [Bacillus ectoiniformans]MBM7649676.1 2'-5' RNA ligase [Bacillus ectoiniformans]